MRIVIAALVTVLINAYYLLEYQGVEVLRALSVQGNDQAAKHLLLFVLGFYLLIEGLLLILHRRSAGAASEESGQDSGELVELRKRTSSMETDINLLNVKLSHRSEEVETLTSERESLSTAMTEAKARLKQAEAEAEGKKRPENVDAEILNLLSLFQEKGRLLDFLLDDITPFADAQVGAAARVVHQGCSSVLKEYFDVQSVHGGKEGEAITLEQDYSPVRYRLVGRVAGDPPFSGKVVHRGWKTMQVSLPRVSGAALLEDGERVIVPAKVEV